MDEYFYQHVSLLLLSYIAMLLFVLAFEFLSLVAVLMTLVLGTVLGFGLMGALE